MLWRGDEPDWKWLSTRRRDVGAVLKSWTVREVAPRLAWTLNRHPAVVALEGSKVGYSTHPIRQRWYDNEGYGVDCECT